MSDDGENKTLSRLMCAVSKSKIYKDTSKVVQKIADQTVTAAAAKASKHYTTMRKKYDEENDILTTTADTSCQQPPSPPQPQRVNKQHNAPPPAGVPTPAVVPVIDTSKMIDGQIIPKYRIIKKTDLTILNDTTNQSIVCFIEIPGVKSSTIEMAFFYSEMVISAKKSYPNGLGDKQNDAVVSESIVGDTQYGDISCKIQLPVNVNEPHKVETNYTDGVLAVYIPMNSYIEPVVLKYKKSRSKNI